MPQYELEESSHPEVEDAGDTDTDADSDPSDAAETAELEDTDEVSGEDEGTPEEDEENPEEDAEEGEEQGEDDLADLIPEAAVADPGAFEIGGVQLKAGEKLTTQQVAQIKHEMERSYFREADYTRKCQELAPIRDRANEVLSTYNEVIANEHANPAALFQHITPEHAIRALAAIGFDVDPNLLQSVGYGNSYRNNPQLNQGQGQNQQPQKGFEQEFRTWQQKQEQAQFTQQLDQEVRAELADIKNQDLHQDLYERILVQAALKPDKSIKAIAMEERNKARQRYSKLFGAKKGQRKGKVVARGSGSSRAVQHDGPQTWDEADRSALGRIRASRR